MVSRNKSKLRKLNLESSLCDLCNMIDDGRENGKIKKRGASRRVLGMIGWLNSGIPNKFVPRTISTVGELYSFTKEEIQYEFESYKEKTWTKLNEILQGYGLHSLNLPREYTAGPYHY